MKRPEIDELYHYCRLPERALEVVQSGLVYSPAASSFNDPFDCSIPFEVDYRPEEYVSLVVRLGREDGKSWKEIRGLLDQELEPDASICSRTQARIDKVAREFDVSNGRLGVLCMSEDPLSVLMWSHYGDKHRGVCLGFARTDSTELGEDDACAPVSYTDDFPQVRFAEIYAPDGRMTDALMFTKAREWAYEKEWRMLTDAGDSKTKIPGPLTRIVVGCNASSSVVDSLRGEAKRLSIPLQRASKVAGKFALKLESIWEATT